MKTGRMTCWFTAALALAVLVCARPALAAETLNVPVVRAARAATPPVLDGKLDDACWQQAEAITAFRINQSGAPAAARSVGYVCFDDAHLYIGMKCLLPKGVTPKGAARPHDAYMFQDDIVEIMVDPGRSQTDYRQFCVNAFGAVYDTARSEGGKGQDPEWNGDWTAKASRGDGFFSVEVAIPYYTLGVRPGMGKTWGLNLARESVKPAELSSIALEGSFHEPAKFAALEGIEANLSKYAFGTGAVYLTGLGQGVLWRASSCVPIQNLTGASCEVRIAVYPKEGKTDSPLDTRTVTLAPSQKMDISLAKVEMSPLFSTRTDLYIVRAQPTRLVISDAKTGEILCVALPSSPPLGSEVIRIAVADPWQKETAERPTETLSLTVHTVPLLKQEDWAKSALIVTLTSKEDAKATASRRIEGPQTANDLKFETRDMPWGAYELKAVVQGPDGKDLAAASTTAVVLPGGKQAVKVLNNLVAELMNAGERGLLGEKTILFMNPRDGWCFFSLEGAAAARLDAEKEPLLKGQKGGGPVEAMRLLPPGRHTLEVEGAPEALIARAIPAMMYNVHETGTQITPFGIHTWERLSKHTLPNCNMIESHKVFEKETVEWRAAGRQWIANYGIPKVEGTQPLTPESALEHWKKSLGYSDPNFDGMQIDEYGPSTFAADGFIAQAQSLARLGEDPAFRGRAYIPFACGLERQEAPKLFMKAVIGSGWPFSEEWYIGETATEQAAREAMKKRLVDPASEWEKALPGSVRRMIVTLMYSALPYCTCNVLPSVDFKVHLDMQMETLANDPVFFGLYGVQPYRSNYADPETLTWMGMLLRHYGIEGRTERLSKDPYVMTHILNGDFDDGADHWQLQPAEADGITTLKVDRLGGLQGRYGGTWQEGNHVLMTRRSAKAPNVFSQEIKDLTPGRLYCLKMYTGDHQDLVQGKSKRAPHAISIQIENADLLPGAENCFQASFYGASGTRAPQPFTDRNGPRYWMNFHWQVFRAKAATATLRISDWKGTQAPGGPAGQEIMFNFIELQPYVAE